MYTGGDVIYENSNNKEYLNGFANAVRERLKAQISLAAIHGGGLVGIVETLIAAAPATLGASVVNVPSEVDWYFAEKEADKNYALA